MVIVASLFEKRAEGLYHNTAAIIDADGRYLGKYRKMHIPDDPQYYEKFYFTPGDLGFRSWDTRFGRIGVLVCWDQWYPEAARLTAMSGAQILFYPTAIGWLPAEKAEHGAQQQAAWETIQRSHAIANGVYVCAVNRVGHEGRPTAASSSGAAASSPIPAAAILVKGGTGEEVLTAACDLRKVDVSRTHWPFLRDRRIDAYGDLRGGISIDRPERERHSRAPPSSRFDLDDTSPRPARLPHARRVGAPPRHLAQLAPQGGVVARQVRTGAGIFATMVRHLADHEEVHINVAGPAMEADVRAGCWPTRAPTPATSSSTTIPPTTPGAATTARSSCSATRRRPRSRPSWTGVTTPGATSIRPTTSTT